VSKNEENRTYKSILEKIDRRFEEEIFGNSYPYLGRCG
jgi:hypothetical protein